MCDVIIFGGTTEGRLLAEYCASQGIRAVVCVVSGYGQQVLPESPWLSINRGAMTREEMACMIQKENPQIVLDATHPYAAVVTENVVDACHNTGVSYVRISREEIPGIVDGEYRHISRRVSDYVSGRESGTGEILWVNSVGEAVDYLKTVDGAVFITTGSKELEVYKELPDYEERLFVRVLPDGETLKVCEAMGIRGKHLIGMQGPFSKELNKAMLLHTGAAYQVTKEAGVAGGFMEKIDAASECGVVTIVIGRPGKPDGISVEAGKRLLEQFASEHHSVVCLNLIGIGMGGPRQMTMEVAEVLRGSDAVLGAPRMLLSIRDMTGHARTEPFYLSRDVRAWMERNTGYRTVSVVYSGDTGFYSGAKTLLEDLKMAGMESRLDIHMYPGISTVSYLCAALKTSWEDVYLASAHGRQQDVLELIENHEKIFLLLGGEDSVKNLCRELTEGGYPKVFVSVGERLSYPDERVTTGTAEILKDREFDQLAAVLLSRSR